MKNIKHKLSILPVALLMLTHSACDLDTLPTTSADAGVVYSDIENVERILNGTWSYLWETTNTWAAPGWSTLHLVNDLMGNDVVERGGYGLAAVYQYTSMNSGTSAHTVLIWNWSYKAIDNMNNIITKIDDIEGDDTQRARIKSQAYALRGYMYLTLATHYAHSYFTDPEQLCAPIYTEATVAGNKGKKQSKLSDVYAQAESDLKEAYDNIGNYNRPAAAKYKINKNVIAGLLARVYLQTGKWDDAESYAEEAQNGYSWMSKADYQAGFNNLSNSEWIWAQGSKADQKISSYVFNYKDVVSPSSGYYSMMADPYFMELFDDGDTRTDLFEWQSGSRGTGFLMYKKFLYNSSGLGDVVMMRKAEMVLIEAEALAEQDLLSQAIAKLNELREARGAKTPNLSALSKEDLIEEILIERRKELFGEGFALSDIKRRQKKVERKAYPDNENIPGTTVKKRGHSTLKAPGGRDFTVNDPLYVFLIPAAEYTNNPNLVKSTE